MWSTVCKKQGISLIPILHYLENVIKDGSVKLLSLRLLLLVMYKRRFVIFGVVALTVENFCLPFGDRLA